MALKAGYYGIKKKFLNQLLGLPADILDIRSEQAVLGAKNQLPITIAELKSLNTEGTWSGDTYTVASVTFTFTVANGYVTKIATSGTASGQINFKIKLRNNMNYAIEKGSYTLNGCPTGGSTSSYYITASKNKVWDIPSAGFDTLGNDVGSGFTFALSEHAQLGISIQIANGINTSGLEFKTMVSFDGGEYVPYAMTNKELTEKVTPDSITITYESGISQNVPNSVAMVKVGDVIILNIDLIGVVGEKSAWVELGTVSDAAKPSVYRILNAILNTKTDICDCQIGTNGVLRIRNNSNAIVATDIIHINGVYF